MKVETLCKGLVVALGIQGLTATALAGPKVKVSLPEGYEGRRGAARLPENRIWRAALGDQGAVETLPQAVRGARLRERMGLAAMPGRVEEVRIKIVLDSEQEPVAPRADVFEHEGEEIVGIVAGGYGFRSLGSRSAVRRRLVREAAYLSSPLVEMFDGGGRFAEPEESSDSSHSVFTEGWALYQEAHVSRGVRRTLYQVTQTVEVSGASEGRPAAELSLEELVGVPRILGSILVALERLPAEQRGVQRARLSIPEDRLARIGDFLKAYFELHPRSRPQVEQIVRRFTHDVGTDEQYERLLSGEEIEQEALTVSGAGTPETEDTAPVAEAAPSTEEEELPGGLLGL